MKLSPAHGPARTSTSAKKRNVLFALAATVALIAGVALMGPWGDGLAPQLPAAPPANSVPSATDPLSMSAFEEIDAVAIIGRVRPNVPSDPAELRTTGWVISLYIVGENGSDSYRNRVEDLLESSNPEEPTWLKPIDVSGYDTKILEQQFLQHPLGVLAVVLDNGTDLSVISPSSSPYGLLLLDPVLMATSSRDSNGSPLFRSVDGRLVDSTDGNFAIGALDQFADFPVKHSFTQKPDTTSSSFKITEIHSRVAASAQACIAVETAAGNKVLAFPAGSTASTSQEDISIVDPVSVHPLRISPPKKPGDAWDATDLTFDALANAKATIKAWPTGETGTCGDLSGEIINFDALSK